MSPSSLFFAISLLWLGTARAQAQQRLPEAGGQIHYDGDSITVEKDGVRLEGNVLFLFGNSFLAADRIHYLPSQGILSAEGQIRLYRERERIHASRLVANLKTNELRMSDVDFRSDPEFGADQASNEILSISQAERQFESERNARAEEILAELRLSRDEYLRERAKERFGSGAGAQEAESARIMRRYGQLLERLARTRMQPNAELDRLSPQTRERIQRRRSVAEQFKRDRADFVKSAEKFTGIPGYSQVRAKEMYQNPDGTYELSSVTISSCKCDPGDLPIWGFGARSAELEMGRYITLQGATLELFTAPVVYSPWAKLPIKTERQSGFLLPSFYASRSGSAVTLPFYLTLGNSADTTLAVSRFSNRGYRLESEARFRLSENSGMEVSAEWIRDSQYRRDWDSNQLNVEKRIRDLRSASSGTAEEQQALTDSLGRRSEERWFVSGSWNIPWKDRLGLKSYAEFTSDNRYLGDFSKEITASTDLLSRPLLARRFLTQEAAAEFYGQNVVLSVRAQGARDLFATRPSETPSRLPRAEFDLLPRRYFGLPVALEHSSSWERVDRVGGTTFLDAPQGSIQVPGNQGSSTINLLKNGRKDPNEAYIAGDRLWSRTRVSLPLPANDYANAFLSAEGVAMQYRFAPVEPLGALSPSQAYALYEANLNLPVYGQLGVPSSTANETLATLRSDLVPGVTFTYIPKVHRTPNFPRTYELFYAADDRVSKQEMEIYLDAAFSVSRPTFLPKAAQLRRVDPSVDPPLADPALFATQLTARKLKIPQSPQELFALSGAEIAADVYRAWAREELARYESAVRQTEFDSAYAWPEGDPVVRGELWNALPLRARVSTTYNFRASEEELEKNSLLRAGEPRVELKKWGPIRTSVSTSLKPLIPITVGVSGVWERRWQRFSETGFSIGAELPYGLTGSFTDALLVTERQGKYEATYLNDRTVTTDLSFQPLPWVRAQYQRILTMKESAGKRPKGELEYAALQRLSFLNLQDCMDVILSREKAREKPEYMAVWSIGVNIRFFGDNRSIGNLGRGLNRSIQERNRAAHAAR